MSRELAMTDDEIRTKHRNGTSIGILAELNACSTETIKEITGKKLLKVAEPKPSKVETLADREAKQLELYNTGKSDSQIADALGVTPQVIFIWRKKTGLPSQKVRKGVMVPPVVPEKISYGATHEEIEEFFGEVETPPEVRHESAVTPPELEPRVKWEDSRKASVMHALFKRLKDVKSLPPEWVEEWNERCV